MELEDCKKEKEEYKAIILGQYRRPAVTNEAAPENSPRASRMSVAEATRRVREFEDKRAKREEVHQVEQNIEEAAGSVPAEGAGRAV